MLLSQITKGKIAVPDFIVLYGTDGIGKSSFGATMPNPIFVGSESGTSNLDVSRFPHMEKFEDIQAALDSLLKEKHDFKTVCIDSLDWVEPLVWEKVCRDDGVTSIEKAHGGYGKGYVAAISLWKEMLVKLKALRDLKKMNVLAIAHAHVKQFSDPQANASYDRFQLKLNDKASALWREAAECVFFANYEMFVKKDENKKVRVFGEGRRLIYTERRPSYDAKNRYGLPHELPLSYDSYREAKEASQIDSTSQLMEQIQELITHITDPVLKEKVLESIKTTDTSKLLAIKTKLKTILGVKND